MKTIRASVLGLLFVLTCLGNCFASYTYQYASYTSSSVDDNYVIYQTVVLQGAATGDCFYTCGCPQCGTCQIPNCSTAQHSPSITNTVSTAGGTTSGPVVSMFTYTDFQTTTSFQGAPGQEYSTYSEGKVICSVAASVMFRYVLQDLLHVWPRFNVAYSAYIPVDHVDGPTPCPYNVAFTVRLIYMGDASRGTYRVTESIHVIPDTQQGFGFFPNTGQTRNYAYPSSPVNGSTLSTDDEDGIPHDCVKWNAADQASPAGFAHDESFPFAHQGQVHYSGSSANPLEDQAAQISWDMRVVLDTTNQVSPTGYVNYNHTCYPAQQIKVNGTTIYLYTPPRNDTAYLFSCLVNQSDKIIGQTPSGPVPSQ
jgi:hypothetical protein